MKKVTRKGVCVGDFSSEPPSQKKYDKTLKEIATQMASIYYKDIKIRRREHHKQIRNNLETEDKRKRFDEIIPDTEGTGCIAELFPKEQLMGKPEGTLGLCHCNCIDYNDCFVHRKRLSHDIFLGNIGFRIDMDEHTVGSCHIADD